MKRATVFAILKSSVRFYILIPKIFNKPLPASLLFPVPTNLHIQFFPDLSPFYSSLPDHIPFNFISAPTGTVLLSKQLGLSNTVYTLSSSLLALPYSQRKQPTGTGTWLHVFSLALLLGGCSPFGFLLLVWTSLLSNFSLCFCLYCFHLKLLGRVRFPIYNLISFLKLTYIYNKSFSLSFTFWYFSVLIFIRFPLLGCFISSL